MFEALMKLVDDPPPPYAFEVSEAGIAWARQPQEKGAKLEIGFFAFGPDVLAVSPSKDNVMQPELFEAAVASLAESNGGRRKRDAVLILPDYSARVAVLDFDQFPSIKEEQTALVRFRMKKTVPFDMELAPVSFQAKQQGGKWHVVAAAAALEIVARYEAAFRVAGFTPGFVTTSALAAVDLTAQEKAVISAKLSGRVMTVALSDSGRLELLRCVELGMVSLEEAMGVLFPTVAYAEDKGARPEKLLLCGFGDLGQDVADACAAELQLTVEPLRASLGVPDARNAGLYGYLQANQLN